MVGSDEIARLIGEQIESRRAERGESQEDVSLRTGLHRTEVSQLERGLRVPRVDTLLKLAGAFEVSIADLVGPLAWEPGSYLAGGFTVEPRHKASIDPEEPTKPEAKKPEAQSKPGKGNEA